MKRDEDGPPAGGQSLGKGNGKGSLEVIEFVIDGDPQGLKHASCRMGLGPLVLAVRKAGCDGVDQIGARPQRAVSAAFDNRVGNRSGRGFFTVAGQKVGQLRFSDRGEKIGRRLTLRRIETHVQRRGPLKAESALRVGQLVGRKPQVEQNSIDAADSKLVEDFRQLGITRLLQDAARSGQHRGCPREHQRIAIETNQFSVGTELFEDETAMTAGSDRSVDHDQPRRKVEELNDFPYEDGSVDGRATVWRGPRRIRHFNRW
jgi:hypothetical protein